MSILQSIFGNNIVDAPVMTSLAVVLSLITGYFMALKLKEHASLEIALEKTSTQAASTVRIDLQKQKRNAFWFAYVFCATSLGFAILAIFEEDDFQRVMSLFGL